MIQSGLGYTKTKKYVRGTDMYIKSELCKEKIFSLLIYCLFILFMILVIGNKKNIHVDEVLSYGLSNHEGVMEFEEGRTYYPSNVVWLDYMTANSENRFHYGKVWRNQASDVHPPLYYAILHTICSFFPGCFSMWFAGAINILFAVGTLLFLRKLAFLLMCDEKLQRILSIAFIGSAGILSAVSFLRMYIMAMFWVTVLTYLFWKQIGESSGKFYVELFLCVVCGALTHYYCVLYAISISIAYGIRLLHKKAWKETGLFCLTQGMAAVTSLAIFPAMLDHVFTGYRGKESFGNLADNFSYNGFSRIITYVEGLDRELFANLFGYIVMGAGICLLTFGIRGCQKELAAEEKITAERLFCVIFAEVLYFGVISLSSPYLTQRYMSPIYAVLFLTIFYLVSVWMKKKSTAYYLYGMIFITTIVCVNGLRSRSNLQLSSEPLIEAAREHSANDCLIIYSEPWRIYSAYYEVSEYHSVTFLGEEHLDLLNSMDLASRSELIVMLNGEESEVINKILDLCPYLDGYEHLGGYAYTNSYYLHGE